MSNASITHFYYWIQILNVSQRWNFPHFSLYKKKINLIWHVVIILKSDFVGDSVTQYALFNIDQGNIVTDMEFFDDKELGICIQTDQSK